MDVEILTWEKCLERIDEVIEILRSYSSIKDRVARSEAANSLGGLGNAIVDTINAELATRPEVSPVSGTKPHAAK